jgi:hypothetical protein
MDGKPVACVDEPQAILIFNLTYGTGIFSTELAAYLAARLLRDPVLSWGAACRACGRRAKEAKAWLSG